MNTTVNGDTTINPVKSQVSNFIPSTPADQDVKLPIDRTNEVLIDNNTTYAELLRIFNGESADSRNNHNQIADVQLTKAVRRPGANQLQSYEPRIAKIEKAGCVCEVFSNGYAIYDNGNRKTVLWVPSCKSVTYVFDDVSENRKNYLSQKSVVGVDVLGNIPWYIALVLAGENNIERNLEHPKSTGTVSIFDTDIDEEQDQVYDHLLCNAYIEGPQDAYIHKENLEEALSFLNENQKLICEMHFIDGYSQTEIADILGITRQSVNGVISRAKKRIKNNLKQF